MYPACSQKKNKNKGAKAAEKAAKRKEMEEEQRELKMCKMLVGAAMRKEDALDNLAAFKKCVRSKHNISLTLNSCRIAGKALCLFYWKNFRL